MRLAYIILLFLSLPTRAHADDLEKYNGKFRLAKEMELRASRLKYLMRDFQLSSKALDALTDQALNEYLDEPANLRALPAPLYQTLVDGFERDLHTLSLETPKTSIIAGSSPAALLGPDGKPFLTAGEIVLPAANPKVSQPERSQVKRILSPSGAPMGSLAKDRAWQIVRQRWRELPRESKIAAIDPNRLNPDLKSVLAIRMKDILTHGPFLANMESDITTGGLEIRDLDQHNSFEPRAFLNGLRDFGKRAGISNYLQDPLGHHDGEASYHIHISTIDPSRDLTEVVQAMNHLYLLRFLNAGEGSAMFDRYGFKRSVSERGLVRVVEPNHFEIRTHLSDPETELREVLEWLTLPKKNALERIRAETARRLDETTALIIWERPNGAIILSDIAATLPTEHTARIDALILHRLEQLAGKIREGGSLMDFMSLRRHLPSHHWNALLAPVLRGDISPMLKEWNKSAEFPWAIWQLEEIGALRDYAPGTLWAKLLERNSVKTMAALLEEQIQKAEHPFNTMAELVQLIKPLDGGGGEIAWVVFTEWIRLRAGALRESGDSDGRAKFLKFVTALEQKHFRAFIPSDLRDEGLCGRIHREN